MEVRRLGPRDVALAGEASRCFGADGDLDPTAFLARRECSLIVATEDGDVAGWVYEYELVHPDGERAMLLYALDVVEDDRGRGLGTTLVGSFVDQARDRGCTEVWVLTDDENPGGPATYRAAGGMRDALPQVMFTWKLAEGRHS